MNAYIESSKKEISISNVFSEKKVGMLMNVLSDRDGVIYTHFTFLKLSRPTVCLSGYGGIQKTVTIDTAKQILKESGNERF